MGFISKQDFEDSLHYLGIKSKKEEKIQLLRNISETSKVAMNIKSEFYLELFDTIPKNYTDLETEVTLATINDRIAGGIWYAISPSEKYENMTYIETIYVRPEFRGTGIGKKLIEDIEMQTGLDSVLHAFDTYIDFYRRIGFRETGQSNFIDNKIFLEMIKKCTLGKYTNI